MQRCRSNDENDAAANNISVDSGEEDDSNSNSSNFNNNFNNNSNSNNKINSNITINSKIPTAAAAYEYYQRSSHSSTEVLLTRNNSSTELRSEATVETGAGRIARRPRIRRRSAAFSCCCSFSSLCSPGRPTTTPCDYTTTATSTPTHTTAHAGQEEPGCTSTSFESSGKTTTMTQKLAFGWRTHWKKLKHRATQRRRRRRNGKNEKKRKNHQILQENLSTSIHRHGFGDDDAADAFGVNDATFRSCRNLMATEPEPSPYHQTAVPGSGNGDSAGAWDRRREFGNPRRASMPSQRRSSILAASLKTDEFDAFVVHERVKSWLGTFRRCDPRYQILQFFNDVANEGGNNDPITTDFNRVHISPLLRMFFKASVFTVWRPTSPDAIRRMMVGEGVGKGLDIKGKSAKRGKLSAFVPFLQITHEDHKHKIRALHKNSKLRIYFETAHEREQVRTALERVRCELLTTVQEAHRILQRGTTAAAAAAVIDDTDGIPVTSSTPSEAEQERAVQNIRRYEMEGDTSIDVIDTYIRTNNPADAASSTDSTTSKYGLAVQERVFWEGMVTRQSITRTIGSDDDTGRSSVPSFMDMNLASLRPSSSPDILGGTTRAVLLQYRPPAAASASFTPTPSPRWGGSSSCSSSSSSSTNSSDDDSHNPMSPLNLVMAYEENDPEYDRCRIIPCVSDFDCFIVGSRGVKYEAPLPKEQVEVLQWSIDQTEKILAREGTESWTKRWLDVLKECGKKEGYKPTVPSGTGFCDPKTKFIFNHAITRLSGTGAVRHGSECFNYTFPQELDDHFLVICDDLPEEYLGRNWAYVDVDELKELLIAKINRGYTFPLNPKWILCDPGWKHVYDQMMASDRSNVKQSMQCWYPSEVRQRIETISTLYPHGFHRSRKDDNDDDDEVDGIGSDGIDHHMHPGGGRRRRRRRPSGHLSQIDGTAAMDLAKERLDLYLIFQSARRRLKAMMIIKSLIDKVREDRRLRAEAEADAETASIVLASSSLDKDLDNSINNNSDGSNKFNDHAIGIGIDDDNNDDDDNDDDDDTRNDDNDNDDNDDTRNSFNTDCDCTSMSVYPK